MEPSESLPYVTHEIGGGEVKFAKLSIDDIFCQLLPEERRTRREKMIANAKLAGLSNEQLFAELENFDDRGEPLFEDFINLFNSDAGKMRIVAYCLKKQSPDAQALSLSREELIAVAWKVVKKLGLSPAKESTPEGSAGDEQNPPRPPAYGR